MNDGEKILINLFANFATTKNHTFIGKCEQIKSVFIL